MCLLNRIRAVLRDSPNLLSTPDLVRLCGDGYPNARSQVWAQLALMRKRGEVLDGFRSVIVPHLPGMLRGRVAGGAPVVGESVERRQRVRVWMLARGVS